MQHPETAKPISNEISTESDVDAKGKSPLGFFLYLIWWENPPTSIAFLVGVTIIFLLTAVLGRSLITVTCDACIFFMLVGLFLQIHEPRIVGNESCEIISKDYLINAFSEFLVWADFLSTSIRSLVLWDVPSNSCQACFFLYCFYYISKSGVPLMFVSILFYWILFMSTFVSRFGNVTLLHRRIQKVRRYVAYVISAIPRFKNITQ